MARLNWLFPKKRGVHRTSSAVGGRAGEAVFFLCLFLLGFGGIIGAGWSYLNRSWPVDTFFPQVFYQATNATVNNQRVQTTPDDPPRFQPQILVEFRAGKDVRSTWVNIGGDVAQSKAAENQLAMFTDGSEILVAYDRLDPTRATIEHGVPWGLWLIVGLLLVSAVAGGYGVINAALQVGASVERRAVLAQAASPPGIAEDETLPAARSFPTVPRDTNLLNSPGVKLKYRLPSTQQPAWRLFGSAVWTLTCGALAVALAVVAVEQHLSGQPIWFLSCFALVVLGLACWAVYHFLYELVSASWMGPTGVEISAMPLRPGGEYDVYLNQAGNLRVRRLRVLLVCDEETTFLQGTDIRHDLQSVYQQEICRREQFEIDATEAVEEHCQLKIPPEAMHSYKSRFNAVSWKLVVEIQSNDWPLYRRTFPVIVYPTSVPSPAGRR